MKRLIAATAPVARFAAPAIGLLALIALLMISGPFSPQAGSDQTQPALRSLQERQQQVTPVHYDNRSRSGKPEPPRNLRLVTGK